ncbi:MAG: chemotaxis response regulator protein-glutamate methylesterase [Candidatus Margulisbacteria bacterium GWF2_35_9]|nr:MAG: chemotaxis response regulator protein-glutamate methylesterase [Candidatus Margulisbacteria bacterium GWF2_35_9]
MKKKVLIVDDSAIIRHILSKCINDDPHLEVIGTAPNPYEATEIMKRIVPDVIVLDIEMPRMDGITFLKIIMEQNPIPIVICSSLTTEGSAYVIDAMRYGALEVVRKPNISDDRAMMEFKIQIVDIVKAAAQVKNVSKYVRDTSKKITDRPIRQLNKPIFVKDKIIVVGASTGGTEAIRVFLAGLPSNCPGIVIVQHMPENFTKSFADHLNKAYDLNISEAKDNDLIEPGKVLIAPGHSHVLVNRNGALHYVEVKSGPLVSRHRPSVDVLFKSAARNFKDKAVGVIMTGMGEDGAKGMLEMKQAGAKTIAQNEDSCVVYGMPKEAVLLGGVSVTIPLMDIAGEVIKSCLIA